MEEKEQQDKREQYRNGGEGFALWCEDNIWLKVYLPGSVIPKWMPLKDLPDEEDEYGRSYKKMWEAQKEACNEALTMKNGRFKYRLIVLCWPRGEGKSLIAVLIKLWKYFNWPYQQIMLGANSKDQIKFVHFDIMRDLILHSPKLFSVVGERNIQEKEIRLTDNEGNIASIIRSISSFTGIVSNITGYTFSEIFAMKKSDFFVQLDGSIRGMPNAMGVIDSTVSSKIHILHDLYRNQDKTSTLFFSYRFSREGNPADYWNPNMTKEQLDDYRIKFPFGDFERYFLNLWSAGAEQIFTDEMVEAIGYFGIDKRLDTQEQLLKAIGRKNEIYEQNKKAIGGFELDISYVQEIEKSFWPVEDLYTLKSGNLPSMATVEDLDALGDLFDTDWVVTGGLDRADPMKRAKTAARTMLSFLAKGLPGSRSHAWSFDEEGAVPYYFYVLLHLADIADHSLEGLKQVIRTVDLEFNGIDIITGERWGVWDLAAWCDEQDIEFKEVYPTYSLQKAAFSEFFLAVQAGRFKSPSLVVRGSKQDDVLREEMSMFDHDDEKRWFGSPEKKQKHGVQDDSMYSIGWNMFGAKGLGVDDFRPRTAKKSFGLFVEPSGMRVGGLAR